MYNNSGLNNEKKMDMEDDTQEYHMNPQEIYYAA